MTGDGMAMLRPWDSRWEIAAYPGGLDIWSATWRSEDGKHIRCLIARTAAELAAKLETADPEISEGGTP